jgi:hypothetical protein
MLQAGDSLCSDSQIAKPIRAMTVTTSLAKTLSFISSDQNLRSSRFYHGVFALHDSKSVRFDFEMDVAGPPLRRRDTDLWPPHSDWCPILGPTRSP